MKINGKTLACCSLFGADGLPAVLYNGVMPTDGGNPFTFAQNLGGGAPNQAPK